MWSVISKFKQKDHISIWKVYKVYQNISSKLREREGKQAVGAERKGESEQGVKRIYPKVLIQRKGKGIKTFGIRKKLPYMHLFIHVGNGKIIFIAIEYNWECPY